MARYLYFAPRALGPVLPRLSHLPWGHEQSHCPESNQPFPTKQSTCLGREDECEPQFPARDGHAKPR